MKTFLKLLEIVMALFGRSKKTPKEIEDEAKTPDSNLDDDIDTIRDGL